MHTQFQLGEIQLITPFFLVSVNLLNAPLITCIHTCVFSVCTVKKKLPDTTVFDWMQYTTAFLSSKQKYLLCFFFPDKNPP